MGSIYRYHCTNCDEIEGEVFYGIGMGYLEDNIDTRLFGCQDCGRVFSRNINKKFNSCPSCRKKPVELVFHQEEEDGYKEMNEVTVKCPNCRTGNIQLEDYGCWD